MSDLDETGRPARRATAADADELVRLRHVMLSNMEGCPVDGGWHGAARETLQARLDEPHAALVAFVVEWPERPGMLADCAVGSVDLRLGGPAILRVRPALSTTS